MQGSVFLSVLLHVLFLALTVLGLPTFSRPIDLPLAIDVELAEVEEPAPEAPVIPPPPPVPKNEPKPLDSPPPPPPEQVAAASPPEPETLDVPAEVLPPPPKPAPATALPLKPEPTRPVAPKAEAAPPLPEPAVAAPPPESATVPEPPMETAAASPAAAPSPPPPPRPKPPSDFDNMLKDLSERVPAPPAEEPPKPDDTIERYAQLDPPPAPVVEDSPEQRFVRARIYGIIQRQIQANWRRPPALQEVEGMKVILDFQLRPDGTIHDLRISEAERSRIDSDALLQSLLDSAQAAIMRTGQIRGLPPENYAMWRHIRLNFRPQQ